MTTQELKEYINSKLGNSLRTLLPSYWWKRLFGLVVDRVNEVENSIATSINEFAKKRPDIDDRTFYMSEDADLVKHNTKVAFKCYSEYTAKSVKPFYIATPSSSGDTIVWWIRSDGFEMTGMGPAFRNVIIDEKKYAVLFISDGRYMSQEMPSDSITVDTEISDTSENAVQNKVIKEYVDKAVQDVNITLDSALSDTSTNAVQNKVVASAFEAVVEELEKKVDKVEGKQLSTEDFTTALKTKLEGMSSFDPTEINNKVDGLQTQINTLVSGDASTAIESFNEITAFLNGVEDTESLDGIIAGIEQQITNKQDTIADLDTIRSGAALGATALQEHQDISHLAIKEEVNNIIVDNESVIATSIVNLDEKINTINLTLPHEYATKLEFNKTINNLSNNIVDNESVIATMLIELQERILNLEKIIENINNF